MREIEIFELEALAALVDSNYTPNSSELLQMTQIWLTKCDRAQDQVHSEMNEVHIVGQAICIALHRATIPVYAELNVSEALGNDAQRIHLSDSPLQKMTWQELSDLLSALQHEFNSFFVFTEASGYACSIDLDLILMCVMKRMGYFLCSESQLEEGDLLLTSGVMIPSEVGWSVVSCSSVRESIDTLHTLMGLTRLLLTAEPVTHITSTDLEMEAHHREASLDDCYFLGMLADLIPGAITQYKNKFRFLFHSITQVIYYHYPSYQRRKQQPLTSCTSHDAKAENVLPLFMQLYPQIPIFYEHSGAGLASLHSTHKVSWIFISGFVLLVDSKMCARCAASPLSLCCIAKQMSLN